MKSVYVIKPRRVHTQPPWAGLNKLTHSLRYALVSTFQPPLCDVNPCILLGMSVHIDIILNYSPQSWSRHHFVTLLLGVLSGSGDNEGRK